MRTKGRRTPCERSSTLLTLVVALFVLGGALLTLLAAVDEVRASADTPPDTNIKSSPSSPTRETTATFHFTSTERRRATFGCSLEGGPFRPCESPKTYWGLTEGDRRFRVRSVDWAGRADPRPASRSWTVDLTLPDTSLRFAPGGEARFEFAADEPVSGFYCSLDGATPARCESPKEYTGLSAGKHVFSVHARDRAGNTDPEPEVAAWTVAGDVAPVVTIEGAPRIESYHEYHYFRFSADVPGSEFLCSLDNGDFIRCASGAYRHVPFGTHTYAVYAVSPEGVRGEAAVVEYESRDPNWD